MSRYIRYELMNVQPIRVADDSCSQSGQSATLKYIPGTAIRGYVVNALRNTADFDLVKSALFSNKVRFLNAYIKEEGHELIPSPKGFYEDKKKTSGEKAVENVVVDGVFTPGYKRAGLGSFCYFSNGCICYYSVQTGSDLKIKVNLEDDEKRNVFRLEYIKPGHTFVGYIALDEENLTDRIKDLFTDCVCIGNARSQGLGQCLITEKTEVLDEIPYSEYMLNEDTAGNCYMLLLSDTVMIGKNGEPEGLNEQELADILGVKEVKTEFCSTSIVNVRGYNRTLGVKTPSRTAYEKGSVFKLSFGEDTIKAENIRRLCDEGIGINKNTGMGRVMILKDYEGISSKLGKKHRRAQILSDTGHAADRAVLKLAAENRYRQLIKHAMAKAALPDDDEFGALNLNSSQLGRVEAIILQNRYDMKEARATLDKFFGHERLKEEKHRKHDDKKSLKGLEEFVYFVLDHDFSEIFDAHELDKEEIFSIPRAELLSEDETDRLKLDFILMRIRMNNRKGIR